MYYFRNSEARMWLIYLTENRKWYVLIYICLAYKCNSQNTDRQKATSGLHGASMLTILHVIWHWLDFKPMRNFKFKQKIIQMDGQNKRPSFVEKYLHNTEPCLSHLSHPCANELLKYFGWTEPYGDRLWKMTLAVFWRKTYMLWHWWSVKTSGLRECRGTSKRFYMFLKCEMCQESDTGETEVDRFLGRKGMNVSKITRKVLLKKKLSCNKTKCD